MTPTFELPASQLAKLNHEMRVFAEAFGKDIQDVTREQGKHFTRDAINYTPPTVRGSNVYRQVAPQEQRRQGEKAIADDLNRLYQHLASLEVVKSPHSQKMAKEIRKLLRTGDYEALALLLKESGVLDFKPKILREASASHHRRFRNSRGRVLRNVKNPFLIVSGPSIGKRKREAKAKVGFGKAGWNAAARGVGLQVPAWMARHAAPGIFTQEGSRHKFSITLGNRVGYMQRQYSNVIPRALERRLAAMQNQLQAKLDGRINRANRSTPATRGLLR